MSKKLKVLFLCTGNSARSQMAEGWTKYLRGDVIEPYSAGIEAHGLNSLAVFRKIRDEIKAFIETLPESLNTNK